MTIYTRAGDDGTTATYGGIRKPKSDLLFYAIGAVDELTSFIGLVKDIIKNKEEKLLLISIQEDLYKTMSFLSGAKVDLKFLEKRVLSFENKIDRLEKNLPKLNRFILPGGTEISSWFHILRAVCRRAERNVVKLFENNLTMKQCNNIVIYLNRLSDLFFVMARTYGKNKEIVL